MKEYIPNPVNLSDVILPEGLYELIEIISENTHEVWAAGRISEGWHYGPERNDHLKSHPYLIPYKLLPETEKQYDRETVLNTIKMVMLLGYRLSKK